MKKIKTYNLSLDVIKQISERAKLDGRKDSDWLDRYLTTLFVCEDFAPIGQKVAAVVKLKTSKFDFKGKLLALGVDKQVLSDWLATRKSKKASNTETAFNSLMKQVEKSGLPVPVAIEMAAGSGWSGFKASWIKSDNSNNQDFSDDSTDWVNKDYGLL